MNSLRMKRDIILSLIFAKVENFLMKLLPEVNSLSKTLLC
jgi:hypothetical protein